MSNDIFDIFDVTLKKSGYTSIIIHHVKRRHWPVPIIKLPRKMTSKDAKYLTFDMTVNLRIEVIHP